MATNADEALIGVLDAVCSGNRDAIRIHARSRLDALNSMKSPKESYVLRLSQCISKLKAAEAPAKIPGNIAGFLDAPKAKNGMDGIVLAPDVKVQIDAAVSEYGARSALETHGLTPANKLLFDGPPGTGKTSVATALGAALGVTVYRLRESVTGGIVGETERNLRAVFDFAALQPCILFIDDIDGLVHKRGSGNGSAGNGSDAALVALLTLCDELPVHTVLIAATNRPKAMDAALLRRFQIRVPFGEVEQWQRNALVALLEKRHGLKVGTVPQDGNMAEVEHAVLTEMRAQVCAANATK